MAVYTGTPRYLEASDPDIVGIAGPLRERFYHVLEDDRRAGFLDEAETWEMTVDSIRKAAIMTDMPLPESREDLLALMEGYRKMRLEEMEPMRQRMRDLLDAFRLGVF